MVFEGYVADLEVDGKYVELQFEDTAVGEYYDKMRPLGYAGTHVVLACFAIDSPDSYRNVRKIVCSLS